MARSHPKDPFSMLKMSLIRHIQTRKAHSQMIRDKKEQERLASDLKNKNQVAGMNLGRLCMKNYILGRPYSDYENDVLVAKMNGTLVGELNHSEKFPAAFRSSVCEVVHKRVKSYLQTPLKQTGFLPPVCLSADKGTYKHRSRQFLSCLTVMPGGNNLLEPLTCGQPVVTSGSSGLELTKNNMKDGFDDFGISGKQIESAVFDGVYFHCSVDDHLVKLYDINRKHVLFTWDPLHLTGLVDKDISKDRKWLEDIVENCKEMFQLFNWGANYEKLREATALWRLSLSNLVTFSATRFANSKRKVFKNIHHEFAPIITCLEEQITTGTTSKDKIARDKGISARTLKGKILNVDFLLCLSGLVDIYEQFGALVQGTQMVHLLPHERMDLFNKNVKKIRKYDCDTFTRKLCV